MAPAVLVYTLAKDQERFPEYMPDVQSVVVIERGPGRTVSQWKTLVEDAPIEWTEEDLFDDHNLVITYRLLEGDLDRFDGVWTFSEAMPGTTEVHLTVEYDFGVPTLSELIGPLLEQKVRENSAMMLAALQLHAQAQSNGQ